MRKRLLSINPAPSVLKKVVGHVKILYRTPEFQNAATVMMYMPLPHELDISRGDTKGMADGQDGSGAEDFVGAEAHDTCGDNVA